MQNTNKVERVGRIIFRTPVLPLKNIYKPVNFTELMQDQVFLSALFLASPVLYEEVLRYKDGKIDSEKGKRKVEESLTKYYLRMSSRSTPFGLFSACGSIDQDNLSGEATENITLPPVSKIKRCSRLDMNYLCALSLYISKLPEVILGFKFYSNSSLYSMGDKWRYVEYYYSSGNRIHQISSVDQDSLVNKIIKASQKGVSFADVQNIVESLGVDCSDEEILEYFKDLISSSILISELEPSITGDDFLSVVIDKLDIIKTDQIIELTDILRNVKNLLNEADSMDSSKSLVDVYKKITSQLKKLEIQIDESKLFQVDSFWEFDTDKTLDPQIYSDVDEAVDVLQKISAPQVNENLKSFAQRFIERYEEQEIPIMQVLDTESGIGYLQEKKNGQAAGQANLKWGSQESLLYSKLQECLFHQKKEIILDENDINDLKKDNALAPSFTVLFRIIQKDDSEKTNIYIENVSGSSTANLLGRFASNDSKILNHIKDICDKEESINPNAVFAEIVHLPQSRVGNILLHPPFRKSEIPYMSLSSVPTDDQILLEDLLVSVKSDKIILRSKKLNKVVVPRLSNAHNYSVGSQPVYHFLCDLQFQGISQWLNFGWGDLVRFNRFLPRITYKNIILQPSIWNLRLEDLTKFLDNKNNDQYQNFKDFCTHYNLPPIFVLSDADNDLPINVKDNQHIDMFLNTVKNKKQVLLKEFFSSTNVLQDEKKDRYNNQFVASYIKKEETYNVSIPQKSKKLKSPTRSFNQNSEWIYFKIYCGIKTSNNILRNSIYSCVNALKKEKLIDSWFFIRYADPHHHIRVRFHVSDDTPGNKEKVISKLMNSIKYYEKNGLIWNIVIDTYKREIERYRDIIEDAETLFSFDSNATLNYLRHNSEDDTSWWMYGLKAIDQTFNDFNLTLNERQGVINGMSISFNKEFQVGKSEKSKLDTMYRDRYQDIYNLVENINLSEDQAEIVEIVSKKSAASRNTITQVFLKFPSENAKKERMFEFLFSYIHMLMNRLCMSDARQEEMIMYNMLMKYYTSKIGRLKHNQVSTL